MIEERYPPETALHTVQMAMIKPHNAPAFISQLEEESEDAIKIIVNDQKLVYRKDRISHIIIYYDLS